MIRYISSLAWVLALNANADAFSIKSPSSLSSPSVRSPSSNFRLFSSSDETTSDEDDQLFKLIGKRSAIRRKKKDELPNEDSVYQTLKDSEVDMESMPEF